MQPPEQVNDEPHVNPVGRAALALELRSVGLGAGLDEVGVCDASILERARQELHRRKNAGLSDTMQFTYRNPDRSTDPARTVSGAKSILVGARSYHVEHSRSNVGWDSETDRGGRREEVWARVAKYAQYDHYAALRTGLEAMARVLRESGHSAVVLADENNLVDREVAWRAGLGWFGKNANVLLPGAGSWFVLGSVVTSAELEPHGTPMPDGCGNCRRCIDACPTGAIVSEGVIDARRCLAWLVQKPGVFPFEYRQDLGDRLYGCDDCQDSCPVTVRLGPSHSSQGRIFESVSRADFTGSAVDVLDILESDDADIMKKFGRWYIPERDPVWVRRNALIILGNVASIPMTVRVEAVLERYLHSDDPYLRAHALWSARRVGADHLVNPMASDSDPIVRSEWDRIASVRSRSATSAGTGT